MQRKYPTLVKIMQLKSQLRLFTAIISHFAAMKDEKSYGKKKKKQFYYSNISYC